LIVDGLPAKILQHRKNFLRDLLEHPEFGVLGFEQRMVAVKDCLLEERVIEILRG
jgi:hypothetical protein